MGTHNKNNGACLQRPRSIRERLGSTAALALTLLVASCGGGGESIGNAPGAGLKADGRQRALAASPAVSGGIMINEIVAGGWKGARDEDGDAEDWVELHNPNASAADLSGYGLSKSAVSPFRWTFPAGTTIPARGYLRVWLSKKNRTVAGAPLHASFDMDSGLDTLILSASNATAAGIVIDSAKPALLYPDHSWCRMPNGDATAPFQVCEQGTPGAANAGTNYPNINAKPAIGLTGGFYAQAQTISISGPAGASLRYTTDGSEPTATSPAYSTPLVIGQSTVLRVAAFGAGLAPSLPETATYVIDATLATTYAGLRAMMIAVPPNDLSAFQAFDKTRDFRASFEYFNAGTRQFRMDAEGSAAGQLGSVDSPQRSMNVKAIDAFGPKTFPAVLWPGKPTITATKKFRLRNGSNDWRQAHLRDQLSQFMSADGPNLIALSTTVAVFINGSYYGMADLREREDETAPENNLRVDKDFVDYLTDPLRPGNEEIDNGGPAALEAYRTMHNFVTGNDMSVAANYAQAKALLNPESLAWDWALHMFHANGDWPHKNVHVWRSPELDGRWTWRPHDMDFSFGLYQDPFYNMNPSFSSGGSEVINALLRNPEFRNLYLNTAADQLSIMTPAYMASKLDAMASEMRPYVADYFAKYQLGTVSTWEGHVNRIRSWINQRETSYDRHNRTQFGLSATRQPITVSVNDLTMGSVRVNQVDTQKYVTAAYPTWHGRYYAGVPIPLEAIPKPGFAFVGWQGASTSTQRRITQTLAAPQLAAPFPFDNYSVRWTGSLEAPVTGVAQLQTISDDAVRVYFDGQLVINNFTPMYRARGTANVNFVAGQRHTIVIEYYELGGEALLDFTWRLPGETANSQVPLSRLYPAGAAPSPAGTGTGLRAEYFANATFTGAPAFVRHEAVNINYASTVAPEPSLEPVVLTAVFEPTGAPAAPVFNAIPSQSARTGDIVSLRPVATDPGGYALTYSATGLPRGVNINAASGVIYGRLTTPGTYNAVIRASNGPATGTINVTWTVTDRPGTGLLGVSPDNNPTTLPNAAPTVQLTSPAPNASVVVGSTITLSATASDSDGTVARVEFYSGSSLLGSATAAPFSFQWTNAPIGTQVLTARAIDNQGAVGTSVAVTVSVTAAPNQAPTVTLTSPANGTSFVAGSTITLNATAADVDGGISRVEFYNGASLLGSSTATPHTFSWTAVPTGVYTVRARAIDTLGAVADSAVATITVNNPNNQPPTVALTAPSAGASFAFGSTITLTASASDSDGGVTRVDFYDGTLLIGSAAAAPFLFNWNNASVGPHTLTARAVDTAGAQTASNAVSITVVAAPPPPNGQGTGLLGRYFANTALTGQALVERIEAIDYNFGTAAPAAGLPVDNFSIRWAGELEAPLSGSYRLQTTSDDGVRVYVNGQLVINNWTPHAPVVDTSATILLTAGQRIPVVVEHQDFTGGAVIQLRWQLPGSGSFQTVPSSRLYAGSATGPAGARGLRAQYFSNSAFTGSPTWTRIEVPAIDLASGLAPALSLPANDFAIRWEGAIASPTSGSVTLRFNHRTDDGIRVWVNDALVINNWTVPSLTARTHTLAMSAGVQQRIRVEYRDVSSAALFNLEWRLPGQTAFARVPQSAMTPN